MQGERLIFSAIFLFLRIIYVGAFILPHFLTISAGIIIAFMIVPLVSYFKPYKEDWCNIWSTFVLLAIGTAAGCAAVWSHTLFAYIVMNILGCLPLLYMILLVLVVAIKKTCLTEKLLLYRGVTRWCPGNTRVAADAKESLPYRLIMTETQH